MAEIVACPSCSRKLSLREEISADQLVKCPMCSTVFTPHASESAGRDESIGLSRQPTDNENDYSPRLLPSDGPREPPLEDDNDDDDSWPQPGRRGKYARRPLLLALLLGGFLATLALVVIAVGLSSTANSDLVGSWTGTFHFAFDNNMPCTYRFHDDGTMVDEHVDPFNGFMVRATGRFTFANGEVKIRWDGGGFEHATVRRTGRNVIEYVIVAHSDAAQIGGRGTFRRAP